MFDKALSATNQLVDSFAKPLVELQEALVDASRMESRVNDLQALKSTLEQQITKSLADAKAAKDAKEEAESAHVTAMQQMDEERDANKASMETERNMLRDQILQLRRDAATIADEEAAKLKDMVDAAVKKVDDANALANSARGEYDSLKRALETLKREHGLV